MHLPQFRSHPCEELSDTLPDASIRFLLPSQYAYHLVVL